MKWIPSILLGGIALGCVYIAAFTSFTGYRESVSGTWVMLGLLHLLPAVGFVMWAAER